MLENDDKSILNNSKEHVEDKANTNNIEIITSTGVKNNIFKGDKNSDSDVDTGSSNGEEEQVSSGVVNKQFWENWKFCYTQAYIGQGLAGFFWDEVEHEGLELKGKPYGFNFKWGNKDKDVADKVANTIQRAVEDSQQLNRGCLLDGSEQSDGSAVNRAVFSIISMFLSIDVAKLKLESLDILC